MYPMEIGLAAGDATRVPLHATSDDFAAKPLLRDYFTHKRAKAARNIVGLNGEDNGEPRQRGYQVGVRRRIEARDSEHGCTDVP